MNLDTIGENVRAFRKQNGFTQEELAGRLGVSYQAVSKWENGATAPDISLLPDLAAVLGTSIDALNVFVEKPFVPDPPDHENTAHNWHSGELFGLYHDWRFERCEEVIFDCNSSGVPHKHCMDTLIAVNTAEL